MYINSRAYPKAYREILNSARASASTSNAGQVGVLVLVAPDVDALCACRILVGLLRHDQIGHNVVPVAGWSELARVNREMVEGNTKLRTIMLLNLGSLVDLSEYFALPEQATLHVIDSHRPYNLDNLFSAHPEAEKIILWDDGDAEEDMKEERSAYEALQYEPESDSDDEEYEDTDDEDLHWRERQRRLLQDSDDDEEGGGGGLSDGGSDSSRGKRRRLDENGNEIADPERSQQQQQLQRGPKRMSKKQKSIHQTRIQRYYASGTWYGQSVAGMMYTLATLLRRADNDYLWLAILGLTHQFTTNLIDRERYETFASVLENEVTRLNITPAQHAGASGLTSIHHPDDRSIRPSEEFRFLLFRHWNLYDSMFHSGYVAGKMKLWRDRGRKNLQGLLAKMGFSLEQCKQSFTHMDMDLKRTLRSKVEQVSPEYGLFDVAFPSFIRSFGYQSILSASDVVECVSALLEVANGVRLDFGNEVGGAIWSGSKAWDSSIGKEDGGHDEYEDSGYGGSDKENNGAANAQLNNATTAHNAAARAEEAAAVAAAKAKKREEAWWVRNFWMAYDSLGNDTGLLRSSLPLSMALHRAIIRQGISILDKQTIKTLRSFRFCIIKEGPDLSIFNHPATLSRLGSWLVDSIRDLLEQSSMNSGKNTKVKALPFILASLDERRDAFLVVGITGAAEYGDVRKNRFGLAFQEAAQASGTRTRHDKFEASIVEVRKDDLAAFIQRIHIKL